MSVLTGNIFSRVFAIKNSLMFLVAPANRGMKPTRGPSRGAPRGGTSRGAPRGGRGGADRGSVRGGRGNADRGGSPGRGNSSRGGPRGGADSLKRYLKMFAMFLH
jgi:hypothetical protein